MGPFIFTSSVEKQPKKLKGIQEADCDGKERERVYSFYSFKQIGFDDYNNQRKKNLY